MKKIIAFLLAFLICFVFTACEKDDATSSKSDKSSKSNTVTTSKENTVSDNSSDIFSDPTNSTIQTQSNVSPLLYKVTDNKGNVAWLFGSVHVGSDDFYPLPNYVMNAFNSADALAVEFDIIAYEGDLTAKMSTMKSFVINNGNTIKNYISDELYNKAVKILKENNSYNELYDYYKPILWSSLIDNILYEKIGANFSEGVDRHLIKTAYDQNKEVLNVESAEYQYSMMANYSYELQAMLLESSIAGYSQQSALYAQLIKLITTWKNGDEAGLEKSLKSDTTGMSQKEQELYQEYINSMYTVRNNNMTAYAENALKSGKEVFICVGAAHVVGEDAMVGQLRSKGYKVEKVG